VSFYLSDIIEIPNIVKQVIPLQLVPIYTPESYPNKYWTAERNTTEWSLVMEQFACTVTGLATFMLRDLVPTLPGAHVGTLIAWTIVSQKAHTLYHVRCF